MILEVECRRKVTNPYTGWQEEFKKLLEGLGASRQYVKARDHYFKHSDGLLRVRDHRILRGTCVGKRSIVSQTKTMLDELYPPDDTGIRAAIEIDISQIDPESLSEELERLKKEHPKLCEVYGMRLSYRIGEIETTVDHTYGKAYGQDYKLGWFIEVGIDRTISDEEMLLKEINCMAGNIRSFIEENLLKFFERINAKIEKRTYNEIVLGI